MKYLLPKQYINQHRVLEKVYDVPSVREFPDIRQIGEALQLDEADVIQAAYLLKGRGYAFVDRDKRPFVVGCTPEGAQALLQKALLEEGSEKGKANLLRWVQIIGILIASMIGVSTFVVNVLTTKRNADNIEALNLEIATLKKAQKGPGNEQ